jgi:hypothetical protein
MFDCYTEHIAVLKPTVCSSLVAVSHATSLASAEAQVAPVRAVHVLREGSPVPLLPEKGDTCQSLLQNRKRFHFCSKKQIESLNKPPVLASGFLCSQASEGQLVCHPAVSGGPKC